MKLTLAALLLCAVSASADELKPGGGPGSAPGAPPRSRGLAHEDANAAHADALKSAMSWMAKNEYKELPFAFCEAKKSKGGYLAIGAVRIGVLKESIKNNNLKCWNYVERKKKYEERLNEGVVLYDQAGDYYFVIKPVPDPMPRPEPDGPYGFAARLDDHITKITGKDYSVAAGAQREKRERTVDDIGK